MPAIDSLGVLIVDDHQVVREGIRALLAAHPRLRVLAEAVDGSDACIKGAALRPDVVIMDLSMPGINGAEATRRLLAASPSTAVVVLSGHEEPPYVRELLNADQRYTSQVAEIIRRDPSLTARLLRLVNSVYYGLSSPVNSIEEAVFYLGVRQIRQLVMVTPVIEDFTRLAGQTDFPWREFWQHCIGTAILAREVLAAQHARSVREVLGPLAMAGQLGGVENATRVALLTGSMSAPQKKLVRDEVAAGEAGIVIGTHALLQDAVDFQNLGMVVVDEQHRFGVEQRDRLRAKAPEGLTPHLLVMTATPIPRTVALTVYGDLEPSTLRELPRGRQPIATNAIFISEKRSWLDRAWARITEEVHAGRQAYVVASRIDESDKADGKDAGPPATTVVELLEHLRQGPLSGLRLGLMHGRLPADEKDAVMAAFRAGELDVLLCTTVIEVGVDVPNATVMFVMDADRFGISQLHQLRGRIGRGEHASLCLLATRLPEGSKAGERLKAVAGTLDGFELADLDLKERREGDVLGYSQSGRPITLRFLSLFDHREIIETARDFCQARYQSEPTDPGLALLAAEFTDTERVEYLDKT